MRLLNFSDIHLDAVTAGRARRSEILRYLYNVKVIAEEQAVDAVIFSGDAHNPGRILDPLYSADLIYHLCDFLRVKSKPFLFAVAGNHDIVNTSELYLNEPVTTLTPLNAAKLACMTPEDALRTYVFSRPNAWLFKKGWAIVGLPYVSSAHADAFPGWEKQTFERAAKHVNDGANVIVVGHRTIPGARMSSESVEMAHGQDQLFPFEEVAKLRPKAVFNGHYHSKQVFWHHELPIIVPGSPIRFTFGEAEEITKGVTLVDLTT